MNDRMAPPARRLASVAWAADQAGVSRSVAYQWARAGRLPGCVEMGGRYYVRVAPFLRWLDGQDVPPSTPESGDLDAARERKAARVCETRAAGEGR